MDDPTEVLVINPNSNAVVTAGIDAALGSFRYAGGPAVRCVTLAGTPIGIESQKDVQAVIGPLLRIVEGDASADAFVIACFGDPGLQVCREATRRPVFGIAECAVLTALARGDRFGVISLNSGSIQSHHRYLRQMGLMSRLAGARALNMSVAESASGENTLARMIEIGRDLTTRDGAEVVIMGCAGMARHRRGLEEALSVPVIDPTQAAVAMAIGVVTLRDQPDVSTRKTANSLGARADVQPAARDFSIASTGGSLGAGSA